MSADEAAHLKGLKKLLVGSSALRAEEIAASDKARKKFTQRLHHNLEIDARYIIPLLKGSRSDATILAELKRLGTLPKVYAISEARDLDGQFFDSDEILDVISRWNGPSTLFSCYPGHLLFWYGETKNERQFAYRPKTAS